MKHIEKLISRYPELGVCLDDIFAAYRALEECYANGGKLLLCGNGGSAADCDHIVGELMKGFLLKRPLSDEKKFEMSLRSPEISGLLGRLQDGLPAIALPSSASALSSAFSNDVDPSLVYAQQLYVLADKKDLLLCISTSGNSKNAVLAALTARAIGVRVLSLTGKSGGKLGEISDITIKAPARETFEVQEYHLPIYHALCAELEARFFA